MIIQYALRQHVCLGIICLQCIMVCQNTHQLCTVLSLSSAISGSNPSEWIEFVAVWLPTSNGFLNCIFYFWINQSFRRKFHMIIGQLCWSLCPELSKSLGCLSITGPDDIHRAWDNNNTLQERSSSVSSTCTLLTLASDTNI